MSLKYYDIDSTYRDRIQHPNPASFTADLGACADEQVVNPVSSGAMLYPDPTVPSPVLDEPLYYPVYAYPLAYDTAQPRVLVIEPVVYENVGSYTSIPLRETQNIFNGRTLELINDDPEQNAGDLTTSTTTISSTVYSTSTLLLETGAVYATVNTTGAEAPNSLTSFYLAQTSSDINGYYVGKTIEVNGESGTVLAYDGGRRLATIDTLLSAAPVATDLFAIYTDKQWTLTTTTDVAIIPNVPASSIYPAHRIHNWQRYVRNLYRIRGAPATPQSFWSATVPAGAESPSTVNFPATASTVDGAYDGMYVWITNPQRLVETGTITIDGAVNQAEWDDITTFTRSGVEPLEEGWELVIQTSWGGTDYLITAELTSNGFTFIGGFPQAVITGDTYWIYRPNPVFNTYRRILSYDGTLQRATLQHDTSAGAQFDSSPPGTPASVVEGDTFDVLDITEDSYHPLDVSTQRPTQSVCYDVSLHSLTLPNVVQETSYGSLIAFYPFIYVQFTSTSAPNVNNLFYSNVPDLDAIVFKVPVYNVNSPESARFVVLDGRGMTQTIKMHPRDSFLVRIYMPNGEIFRTAPDNMPPLPPNPALQISVCIGVRRVG
jgi:hypothetical protein